MKFRQLMNSAFKARRGQTMAEYALILATVVIAIMSLYGTAGTIVSELVGKVGPYLTGP